MMRRRLEAIVSNALLYLYCGLRYGRQCYHCQWNWRKLHRLSVTGESWLAYGLRNVAWIRLFVLMLCCCWAGSLLAQDASTEIAVKRIVTEDLQVLEPSAACRLSIDGIVVDDSTILPWWNVLEMECDSLAEDQQRKVQDWQEAGTDWKLLRGRLDRGERYRIGVLTDRIANSYPSQAYQLQADPSSDTAAVDEDAVNDRPLPSFGQLHLLRWQSILATEKDQHSEAIHYLLLERKQQQFLTGANETSRQASETFYKQYALIGDWLVDDTYGVCWQVPPIAGADDAEIFLQQSAQWEPLIKGPRLRQVLETYQLMAAASLSKKRLQQTWQMHGNGRRWDDPNWEKLINQLVSEEPDLKVVNRLVTELEGASTWGGFFVANWLAGRMLLQSEDDLQSQAGTGFLLKIAMVDQRETNSRSKRSKSLLSGQSNWAKTCLRCVIKKNVDSGGQGKIELLEERLESLN